VYYKNILHTQSNDTYGVLYIINILLVYFCVNLVKLRLIEKRYICIYFGTKGVHTVTFTSSRPRNHQTKVVELFRTNGKRGRGRKELPRFSAAACLLLKQRRRRSIPPKQPQGQEPVISRQTCGGRGARARARGLVKAYSS
jgi:hypothetical protein